MNEINALKMSVAFYKGQCKELKERVVFFKKQLEIKKEKQTRYLLEIKLLREILEQNSISVDINIVEKYLEYKGDNK